MSYAYKPMYYSSFQDTITTFCKSILPFSFKNRLLQADQKHSKRLSENLKWQQDSFHRILNLISLHKEGIVPEAELTAFRSHLIETLIASPSKPELPAVIRDKLLFLQELLYAKCISLDEYHSSKRPLLQRLAAQDAEIDCRDVIVGNPPLLKNSEEQWSVIDLNDQELPKAIEKPDVKPYLKSLWRGKIKKELLGSNGESSKRKPFHGLFQTEKQGQECNDRGEKISKKQWGFEGLRKWKRSSCEDDSSFEPYLTPVKRSDDALPSNQYNLVSSPIGEGPDTKRIKKKIHFDGSSNDFFIDKVLGENIKKELSRIQSELSATNQNLKFSDEQIEAISMKLPVDKTDLNKFFPKSWCNAYGDVVLEVVKKEFKDHVGEMENLRNVSKVKSDGFDGKWVAFEDDNENFHPNLFSQVQLSSNSQGAKDPESAFTSHVNYNPFSEVQNPFWPPKWDN